METISPNYMTDEDINEFQNMDWDIEFQY